MNVIEILQVVTLGFVGVVWTEIREIRNDLADSRERLKGLEALRDARTTKGNV